MNKARNYINYKCTVFLSGERNRYQGYFYSTKLLFPCFFVIVIVDTVDFFFVLFCFFFFYCFLFRV